MLNIAEKLKAKFGAEGEAVADRVQAHIAKVLNNASSLDGYAIHFRSISNGYLSYSLKQDGLTIVSGSINVSTNGADTEQKLADRNKPPALRRYK